MAFIHKRRAAAVRPRPATQVRVTRNVDDFVQRGVPIYNPYQ